MNTEATTSSGADAADSTPSWKRQALVAVLILAVCVVAAVILIKSRKPAEPEEALAPPPLVSVVIAESESLVIPVEVQATVRATGDTEIAPEVSGRVIWMADNFVPGGVLQPSQPLLRVDARDYQLLLDQARARVAQAERALAQVEVEAEQSVREWNRYGQGEPPPLARREPQLNEARAALATAQADVRRAELTVARSEVQAPPYRGRVQGVAIGLGQFVSPGRPIAKVFPADELEVRLPLTDKQRQLLGIEGLGGPLEEPLPVKLTANSNGRARTWSAGITRVESTFDLRTRLAYAIAEVNPDQALDDLAPGQFVNARIEGAGFDDVFSLPRAALLPDNRLYLVDGDSRLRVRDVDVVFRDDERVVVGGGLENGEQVIVRPPEYPVEGMIVTTRTATTP
ncbi:efflux RND transporter periplasmic adaptor subunit [uncultured Abyssibacter sp.]|uniref:efflux RND transporter periplasmic adaptor subunit n=1 Tax=uncultured Abyssibacter sp. TaxID=2320202 RepID=UPI0032B2A277